jgi:hypothetical protein
MASNSVNEPGGSSKSGMWWILAIIAIAVIAWWVMAGRNP